MTFDPERLADFWLRLCDCPGLVGLGAAEDATRGDDEFQRP
jgi:hypothetical protein